jgi:exopolysaccharide biosynthesis WecB/TagA/CpsF family protein
LSLDHAVKLQRDPRFRAAYAAADVVTADGWPIAWIARLQDARVKCTTGADLFLPLTDAAAQRQIPVFLIGSSPGVLARAGKELCQRTEGTIAITGTLAPSQSFDPEGAEADAAIEKIRLSGAKLCFAALGAPKQEIFALRAREQGLHCCVVCVGAALDFTAGEQIRAPEVLRDNGLRWGWRLGSNLHRLAKRYVESAVMFAYLLATEPRRHRLSRAQKSI